MTSITIRSPEVEQVPDTGERDPDCAVLSHELPSDAVYFEKVHTLASIVLIQRSFEPNFVTQATYAPKGVINLHTVQQVSTDATSLFSNMILNGFLQ